MSRAEEALGPQRYTGGDAMYEERVARAPRGGVKPGELRGTLSRITALGRVLHSQRVRWTEWPRDGRALAVTVDTYRAPTWYTERVRSTKVTVPGHTVEFEAGGVRYRLEKSS